MKASCRPIVTLLLFFLAGPFASPPSYAGERPDNEFAQIRRQCESILKKSLDAPLPENVGARETVIWRLKSLPIDIVESKLTAALDDTAAAVQLTAAEVLIERTGMKHTVKIEKALSDLKPITSLDRARAAVLRLRIGQENALDDVRRWAQLDTGFIRKLSPFICAMHPQVKRAEGGRCPICSLELFEVRRMDFGENDYHAQYVALRALAERKDERAVSLARGVLTGSAGPLWRARAAHLWAIVSPEEGLPHFRVYLHANDQHIVQETSLLLARDFAEQSVAEFQTLLDEAKANSLVRITAAEGLVRAGREKHLDEIRRVIDAPESNLEDGNPARAWAFVALEECGTAEDIKRLKGHLAGEWRDFAARAILRLVERISNRAP